MAHHSYGESSISVYPRPFRQTQVTQFLSQWACRAYAILAQTTELVVMTSPSSMIDEFWHGGCECQVNLRILNGR